MLSQDMPSPVQNGMIADSCDLDGEFLAKCHQESAIMFWLSIKFVSEITSTPLRILNWE
jgi:hypothetical protein